VSAPSLWVFVLLLSLIGLDLTDSPTSKIVYGAFGLAACLSIVTEFVLAALRMMGVV